MIDAADCRTVKWNVRTACHCLAGPWGDIPPPQPGDKYRLGLGAIAIGGVTTPLPVFDSCRSPARAGLDYVRC
jgi:hypothetical protein